MLVALLNYLSVIDPKLCIYLVLALAHAALAGWKVLKKDWLSGGCYLVAFACYSTLTFLH